jgi:hypothetical protein
MEPIYNEFKDDLNRIKDMILLLENIKHLAGLEIEMEHETGQFSSALQELHGNARNSHVGLTVLPATLLLYLGGRFENYVKTIFEELCVLLANRCQSYARLPKKMRESIVKLTAEVISNPRKYGHAENGVASFIKNLNSNITSNSVEHINTQCLSITNENMRADTLNELFGRIGFTDIWERISEQPKVKLLLNIAAHQQTLSEAKKTLNEFVETRNKIAHPSGEFNWPSKDQILFFIDFLDVLAFAIKDTAPLFLINFTPPEIRVPEEVG